MPDRVKVLQEIEQDCSEIVEFCETWRTQQLYQAFAPTWDAFCVDILHVEPAWVDQMCAGLALLRAEGREGSVPADEAVEAFAQKVAEVEALRAHGTNQHSEGEDLSILKSSSKGPTSRYFIARLKRDHPDIAEALARGDYPSVRAAAKAAGFVREPSPLDYLRRYWRKASPEDRAHFLAEIRPPAERCGGARVAWPTEGE